MDGSTGLDDPQKAKVTTFEPKDYFEELKTKVSTADSDMINSQLDHINSFMVRAREVGQKNLLHKLVFAREVIAKEQKLLQNGINKYVLKDDISKFIDTVTPKNSVKIIELERFPRAIPIANMDAIAKAKKLDLFTNFCVVFTDLTNQKYETVKEKEFVAKNRDPIVFGYFMHDKAKLKHERFYFVTDWEDEFCDLTFTKMIDKMAEMGMPDAEKTISTDEKYLTQIANDALAEMDVDIRDEYRLPAVQNNKSFWERFKNAFKK